MFPSKSDKRKKRRRGGGHKRLAITIGVIAVIAAGIVAYFVFFDSNTDSLSGVKLRIPYNASIEAENDSIYYLHEKTLGCVDYSDSEKWTVELSTTDLKLAASNDLIAVYNANAVWLYGFDGTALLSEPIQFAGLISDVKCGVNTAMVRYEDSEKNTVVDTINTKGESIGASNKSKDRFIVDFGYTDGDSSFIYTIDVGSVTPVSRVSTRNEQQADTGYITVEGQVLYKAIFRSDGIYAIGTKQIIKYNYIGEQQTEHLIYGWRYEDSILNEQQETYILLSPGGDTALDSYIPTARLHTPDKPDISIQLNAGTKRLFLGENKIYTFTSDRMVAYSFDGKKMGEFPALYCEQEIIDVIKAPYVNKTDRALICTNEAVYSVRLP